MYKQLFIVKVKKSEVSEGYAVPRHPELEFVSKVNEEMWKAKNNLTGVLVYVTKTITGNFVEYELIEK